MTEPKALQRLLAKLLVLGQVSLLLTSCLSVQARPGRSSEGPGGGVAVQVFAADESLRAGHPGPDGIMGELQRRRGNGWETVFRSLNPTWAVTGLPAGTYRVAFPARLDSAGNIVRLNASPKDLAVTEGRITEVRVVLSHVSTGAVVAGVVAAVAAAVLLSDFLSDHDLPEPPLPPPELVDVAFQVSLDLAVAAPWVSVSDHLAPVITSHFPANGAVVAAARPRVVFSFSEPLQAGSIGTDAVTVLGEASGIVPGTVSYDAKSWLVTFSPQQDLLHGDMFHVTLDVSQIEDGAGNEPAQPVSFTFTTPR